MPYQVSMMGWVGSGEDFFWVGLGWIQKFWVGLGFEKVTHDQLCIYDVPICLQLYVDLYVECTIAAPVIQTGTLSSFKAGIITSG